MTDGLKDFGASEMTPWMPFLWGSVLMAAIFEPILCLDSIKTRIEKIPDRALFIRGICCGVSVFLVWAFLYEFGTKYPGFEMLLIFVGYIVALALASMTILGGRRQNQSSHSIRTAPPSS